MAVIVCTAIDVHAGGADRGGSADGESMSRPGASAAADSARQEVVLWTFRTSQVGSATVSRVRDKLDEALSEESGRHLFDEKALGQYLGALPQAPPRCLQGLQACVSAQSLAFDKLGLTMVVEVAIERRAGRLEATYSLVDRRGRVGRTAEVGAADPRALALALAGDIFDATATVTLRSQPAGARVEIDGQPVGTAPLDYRLAVGQHRYRMSLGTYAGVGGTFEVKKDTENRVDRSLSDLPAVLVVAGAPATAKVVVDGERRAAIGEPVELAAGSHELEVRADGFKAYHGQIELAPGQRVDRRVRLDQHRRLMDDVEPNAVAVNHYIGRLSYDHSLHKTTFRDARGALGNTRFEFLGFSDADGASALAPNRRELTAPRGARLDFTYSWQNFGLVLLSMSYESSSLDLPGQVSSSDADRAVPVDVTGMRRLQLRPLQLRYRHFFGNWAPFAELGTGINIQWVDIDAALVDAPVTLSNSEAFWTLGVGGSYYLTSNIFGMVRYSAQFYFDDGLGAEHVFSVGAGVALPNLFGVEPEPPETL